MPNIVYRRYEPGDARAVSQLFRVVYGDHYVQPDVYMPSIISQHNADGCWISMLAVDGERVLGHAALCNDTRADTPELALSVQVPDSSTTAAYAPASIAPSAADHPE